MVPALASPSLSPSLAPLARADARWSFTLVPAAAEGGGSFRASIRRVPEYVARGQAADPDRAAAEAARRARTRLRRYCAANVLNRLGTLTYRGEGNHDTALIREHLGVFFRDLRAALGVLPREVVNAFGGGGASEPGVGSVVIVVMEPVVVGRRASGV